jgi:hypothetical protein
LESDFSPEELTEIRSLVDLGFEFEQAAAVWRTCGGNTALAAEVLLSID